MKKLMLLSIPLVLSLAACGGSDGGSTSTSTSDSGGVSTTVAKAKLSVTMPVTTLKAGASSQLTLKLTNSTTTAQTVSFTLGTPTGGVSYNAVSFSAPCNSQQLLLSVGGSKISNKLIVPANTTSGCQLIFTKTFDAAANPAVFTLVDLENVELEGSLPAPVVTL